MLVCQNNEGRWVVDGLVNRPEVSVCSPNERFLITDVRQAVQWIEQQIQASAI